MDENATAIANAVLPKPKLGSYAIAVVMPWGVQSWRVVVEGACA